MTHRGIDADPEYHCLSVEALPFVTQSARLGGATGSVVLRIEIRDHRLPLEVLQRNLLAISLRPSSGDGGECRCCVSGLQFADRLICADCPSACKSERVSRTLYFLVIR